VITLRCLRVPIADRATIADFKFNSGEYPAAVWLVPTPSTLPAVRAASAM
jgi:hypothetical protein